MKTRREIWRCECGDGEETEVITAPDGEVICRRCGAVLGLMAPDVGGDEVTELADEWDADADICRKILEARVSKKGWQF